MRALDNFLDKINLILYFIFFYNIESSYLSHKWVEHGNFTIISP